MVFFNYKSNFFLLKLITVTLLILTILVKLRGSLWLLCKIYVTKYSTKNRKKIC